jgi:predicted alpha/beta superfamily hydrolase
VTAAPEGWLEYVDWRGGDPGTVVGRVLVRERVRNEVLGNERHILVLVPPSWETAAGGRRYPVVYMHDGQNLFDARTGPDAEWQIDETLRDLAWEGLEAFVVGVPNAQLAVPAPPEARALEYTRFARVDRGGGGSGGYLEFIAATIKPLLDDAFPTIREPVATGIAGSSLGGLISLDGLATRPNVFGFGGICSPAFLFDDDRRTLRELTPLVRPPQRVYVDVGGDEGSYRSVAEERAVTSATYLADARRFVEGLRANGLRDGDELLFVEDAEAMHHETAWAARAPAMLRFLLAPFRAP